MPTTPLKNLLYRAVLPFLAPSVRGRLNHRRTGHPLLLEQRYLRLLYRNHVHGSALVLKSGKSEAAVYSSIPGHDCGSETFFRVASITKMATALVTLRLCEAGCFRLEDPADQLLPDGMSCPALRGVTLRHLLTHTSGLQDPSNLEQALLDGMPWRQLLDQPGVRKSQPGQTFRYSNLGFGLMGCVMEAMTEKPVSQVFAEQLTEPLDLRAELDAARLPPSALMPLTRILPYRPGQTVTVTALGSRPLIAPDPERHFGHTAGALYADAKSISRLLDVLTGEGSMDGSAYLQPDSVREMLRPQASYGRIDPRLRYGLGVLLISDPRLSSRLVMGHQGYAYGCVDGAFAEAETGRQMVFLNGGCSEARHGRLGICNEGLLRYAFREELPAWR